MTTFQNYRNELESLALKKQNKTSVCRETEEYKKHKSYDHWLREDKTLSTMLSSKNQDFVSKEYRETSQ